jgi:arylsulfatase A
LPLSEKTIAGALKPGHVSGLFGKWHLGHRTPKWLPTNYGFDEFFGLPYSHDIMPLSLFAADAKSGKVKENPVDLPRLQQAFYSRAEAFIERHRKRPFFVELALSSPHLPAHVNPEFNGRTQAGPYGDTVAEIDSIVGRLLDKLKALELDQDTLVLFTSDNGPWFEGSSGPLRDRKGGAAYDGGYRVPFLAWAPGIVPAGERTDALICGIDLLPTFCSLAGRELPKDVQFDGRDITGVLTTDAASPHAQILLFNNEDIVGVRTQEWKYVEQTYYRGLTLPMESRGYPQLYDMKRDIAENYSVAQSHPDVTADMQMRLKRAKEAYAQFKRGMPPSIQRRIQERAKRSGA